MTVAEFIVLLQTMPQDMQVYRNDSEDTAQPVENVIVRFVFERIEEAEPMQGDMPFTPRRSKVKEIDAVVIL